MNEPLISVKENDSLTEALQLCLHNFWNNGGKEKYTETLELRKANGIPDKQWFAANLMGIIDDAEITYENGNDSGK